MKKNTLRWWVTLAVVLVVYNVIVFAVPFSKTPVFFISWLFTIAAICAQIYVILTAFYKGEDIKSKLYGFPIARVGAYYLVAQLVAGLVFITIGNFIPVWVPVVLFTLMLGAAIIGFVSVDAIRDEADRQDIKLKKDVSFMRALQSKAETIAGQIKDERLHKQAREFADALRYSDPVSNEALSEIETELISCVDEIQEAISNGDSEISSTLFKEAGTLLTERNRLCKLSKSMLN